MDALTWIALIELLVWVAAFVTLLWRFERQHAELLELRRLLIVSGVEPSAYPVFSSKAGTDD